MAVLNSVDYGPLPSGEDFRAGRSGDARWAVEILLGRPAAELREEVRDKGLHWLVESLIAIGPNAAAYYIRAAIEGALDGALNGDGGDALLDLMDVLRARLEGDGWDVGQVPGFDEAVRLLLRRVKIGFRALCILPEFADSLRARVQWLEDGLGGCIDGLDSVMDPISVGLSTDVEANIGDAFGEREAMRAFWGKTGKEMAELFANGYPDLPSLACLGPTAFAFYLPAAIEGALASSAKCLGKATLAFLYDDLVTRAEKVWERDQLWPPKLDAGMVLRLPDLIAFVHFLEQAADLSLPSRDEGRRLPGPDEVRHFMRMLESVRDGHPRPVLSGDGRHSGFEEQAFNDGMVFIPKAADVGRSGFLRWYSEVTTWSPGYPYRNPERSDSRLRAWYEGVMSDISDDGGTPEAALKARPFESSFCFAENWIYFSAAAFGEDSAEENAARCGLGVFWVSHSRREVLLPAGRDGLVVAHQMH